MNFIDAQSSKKVVPDEEQQIAHLPLESIKELSKQMKVLYDILSNNYGFLNDKNLNLTKSFRFR